MKSILVLGAAIAALVVAPRPAHAAIEACGNFDVRASSRCKLEVSGSCSAQCEPVRLDVACAAKLARSCAEKNCKQEVTVQCSGGCMESEGLVCKDDLNGVASIDCSANCDDRCGVDCDASCASAADKADCALSCKASCDTRCTAACKNDNQNANCRDRCGLSCGGSCRAQVNRQCDLECQASGSVSCKAELQASCKAQCDRPEGALFCDGKYVDVGSSLPGCLSALNQILDVKVDVQGSAGCVGSGCSGQGSGTISVSPGASGNGGGCTCAPLPFASTGAITALGLAAVGATFLRRRSRR